MLKMKTISILAIAGLFLALAPAARAATYEQDFNNDGDADAGLSTVGWSALGNLHSTGLNVDASTEAESAGIAKTDYAFFAPQRGILTNEFFLAYTTDSSVNVDVSRVESVGYSYSGDPVGAKYRVAVQVGGVWYAEATGTDDPRDNPGNAAFLSTLFAPSRFVAAANWVTVLNASVGAIPMALGAAPGRNLSGTMTAIGLLLDCGSVEDHLRFDAFAVTASDTIVPDGTMIIIK